MSALGHKRTFLDVRFSLNHLLYPRKRTLMRCSLGMSALCQLRTFWQVSAMSPLISKADICSRPSNVRLGAISRSPDHLLGDAPSKLLWMLRAPILFACKFRRPWWYSREP